MDWTSLIGLLAVVTLLLCVGLAYLSKRRVDARMEDPEAPKSTLAADVPSRGTPADV